jgi:hypothetical protein
MRTRLACSTLLFAAAVAACGPRPTNPRDVQGPGPIDVPPGPHLPGVAYADLACSRPVHDCNALTPFEMHVVGNQTNLCRITPDLDPEAAPNTSKVSVQIGNANDATQLIAFAFDGYRGSGSYALDHPNDRHVSVSQGQQQPAWDGPSCGQGAWTGTASRQTPSVGAPDTCGADACSITVTDADPTATPRRVTFAISCAAMCINGGDTTCRAMHGPTIDLEYTAECTN